MPFYLRTQPLPLPRRGRSARLGPRLVAPLLLVGLTLILSLALTVNPVIFPVGVLILFPITVLIGFTV